LVPGQLSLNLWGKKKLMGISDACFLILPQAAISKCLSLSCWRLFGYLKSLIISSALFLCVWRKSGTGLKRKLLSVLSLLFALALPGTYWSDRHRAKPTLLLSCAYSIRAVYNELIGNGVTHSISLCLVKLKALTVFDLIGKAFIYQALPWQIV